MPRVYARRWVKIGATGSTRFHNTLWKKSLIGSHFLIHWRTHTLGFRRKPNPISIRWLGHTKIQTIYYCITEAYPVLIHWWVVYAILLLCWSTACFITLLSYTQHFYIAELYAILIHCWCMPYLITLLSNSQKPIHCWAIPNPNTLLRYSLS